MTLLTLSCKKENDQPEKPSTYYFKAEIEGEQPINFEYVDQSDEISYARVVDGDVSIHIQDPSCANWFDCLRVSMVINSTTTGDYRPQLFQIGLRNNPTIIHSFHNSPEFDTLQMTVKITQLVKGNPGFITGTFNGQMRKVDTENNFEILARPMIQGSFATPYTE